MKKIMIAGILLLAILASVGCVSAGALSTNLVVNGGFETPVKIGSWQLFPEGKNGSGWNVEAQTPVSSGLKIQNQSTTSIKPFEGSQFAQLSSPSSGAENGPVGISQMIPQVKGTIYRISFAQRCRAEDPAPGRLGVYWGSTLLDRARCSANETSAWVTRSYTVTATSNDPVMLKFTSEGSADSSGVLLDNVNVDAANETLPVPEFPLGVIPAFLFGLVGFIHIIRKDN
jgi:hypothetical protein